MKTLDLGKVAIRPKGEYSPDALYDALDLITHNNASWLVLKDVTGITPTSGEYYQLLAKDGVGKKRTVRAVIGTSTNGWTEDDCDYLCDGVDDQVEINAAIQALPEGGGEIIILDGTYHITAPITLDRDNVALSGNGNTSRLIRMWDSETENLLEEGVITITAPNGGCKVEHLLVDGDAEQYVSEHNAGIYLQGGGGNVITDTTCKNQRSGISLTDSKRNQIIHNTCSDNRGNGVRLLYTSTFNIISGNDCARNQLCGIYAHENSKHNSVTGNSCTENGDGIRSIGSNTITGNSCNCNHDTGILICNDFSSITGNTCNYNESKGISVSYGDYHTIVGNTCIGNTEDGIYFSMSSECNTITGNNCGKNSQYGISVYSGLKNTITGNSCNGNSSAGIFFGIASSNNLCVGNICISTAITDNGTGNVLTENKTS